MRRGGVLVPPGTGDQAQVFAMRCTGVVAVDGWRLKLYEAAHDRTRPRRALVDAATALVRHLPQPPEGHGRAGTGFLYVQDGRDRCLVVLGWWTDAGLSQFTYRSSAERPGALEALSPGDDDGLSSALAVVAFERQAWLEDVLANPDGADVDRYLATRFEAQL